MSVRNAFRWTGRRALLACLGVMALMAVSFAAATHAVAAPAVRSTSIHASLSQPQPESQSKLPCRHGALSRTGSTCSVGSAAAIGTGDEAGADLHRFASRVNPPTCASATAQWGGAELLRPPRMGA